MDFFFSFFHDASFDLMILSAVCSLNKEENESSGVRMGRESIFWVPSKPHTDMLTNLLVDNIGQCNK